MPPPFKPVSEHDYNNFKVALKGFEQECTKRNEEAVAKYNEGKKLLDEFLPQINMLIRTHTGTGASSIGSTSRGTHNPPIQLVKSLLGKLKNLIPRAFLEGP